jgi:hypothetical protein
MEKVAMVRGVPAYLQTFTDRGGTTVVAEAMVKPDDRYVPHDEVCCRPKWFKVDEVVPPTGVVIDFEGIEGEVHYHYVGMYTESEDGNYFETSDSRFREGEGFIVAWRLRGAPEVDEDGPAVD